MHGWMTSRHEGCVSTMLTDKRLEYCTAGAPLQGSGATKWMMQDEKHGVSGVFRLDNARSRQLQRGVTDTPLNVSVAAHGGTKVRAARNAVRKTGKALGARCKRPGNTVLTCSFQRFLCDSSGGLISSVN
jgi:hypothetical protein